MTPRSKGLWALGVTFVLTLLTTIFKEFEPGYAKGNWLIWMFWSWNYFAYAFDKRMLPWQFIELKGNGEGHPLARKVVFWGTAVVYLAFLALVAFAG